MQASEAYFSIETLGVHNRLELDKTYLNRPSNTIGLQLWLRLRKSEKRAITATNRSDVCLLWSSHFREAVEQLDERQEKRFGSRLGIRLDFEAIELIAFV